jgi:hypothetical protein
MSLEEVLDSDELEWFETLTSPTAIQSHLDNIPYVGEELNRSPLRVIRDRQCHCLDGGLFAAAALRRIGYPPLLLDLVPEPSTDDDHVLVIFQRNGLYGAVAKSNFTGLRYREPVFRSLRELVMSYFEDFFNIDGVKTMRGYTRPLNLSRFDSMKWETTESGVEQVVKRLYSLKSIPVINPISIAELNKVDEKSYHAGVMGTDFDWLYKPVDIQ